MTPKALLFGAIGTLVETSDLQRRAFNAAFSDAGMDWTWDADTYRGLLTSPGGRRRIADYAQSRGQTVDADALHGAKVRHFERMARDEGLRLRDGVTGLIGAARDRGMALGLATTTGADTVDLVFAGLDGALTREDFDFIGSKDAVPNGKPAPDIYLLALGRICVAPDAALAIEDTPESAAAAIAAGIETIAFPGWAAAERDFPGAALRVTELGPDLLGQKAA